ncbi:galactose oxidase [Bradyrhizobium sp. 200]|uniref:Kelch repeat-containing protein n=1 Tax=Bradyrhizobium sp. 200 TaxID=2782665 RepID=UPI001FFF8929|nr:kelch repeat-containing protein [Bradyrhizobium sp. 200]UPJ49071.1 galactose oxidase [Bradyrhizobium sp. 200]
MSSRSDLPRLNRRAFVAGAASATVCTPVLAQHSGHGTQPGAALREAAPASDPFARLQGGTPHHLTSEQIAQRKVESPAPKGPQGHWTPKAALPLPRSEMAWATAWAGRMHIVGGYGEGRVDRAYHHVYAPKDDRWFNAAPLPRGANHVAVVADAGRVYALGGFIEQNRNPDPNAYAYDVAADKWTTIAPLSRSRGAAAAVALDGKIHLIGGAGAPTNERASVGWHEVYDPQTDKWEIRKAMPAARDHVGAVAYNGMIHIIGGRFNTFEYNTDLHHVYLPSLDTWKERAPLPTARSGHGLVAYRDRFFAMGGEYGVTDRGQISQGVVFGQMESYDPQTNTWQSHAPMTTPRHAVGATTIGDAIYVAGGGAVTGGSVQSSVHEAFTLAA